MKKILITGASGFIGNAFMQCLGHADFDEIHAVSRTHKENTNITWHSANFLNYDEIAKVLEEVRPTHILHCAWEVTPRLYSTALANEDWLKASIYMAALFKKLGGSYFLGIGSSAEYEASDTPCREDFTPLSSPNIYGQSKISFCKTLMEMNTRDRFCAGWLRVFLPYGPRDPIQRLIPSITQKLKAGERIETTHGYQKRDFIHVNDIAKICIKMLQHNSSGIYNAGSGQATPIRDVISYIANKLNSIELVQFDALPLAASEPMLLVADMAKTRQEFNFNPEYNLFEFLDTFIDCKTF